MGTSITSRSPSNHGRRSLPWFTLPWFTLGLGGLAALVFLGLEVFQSSLVFDREAIARGEFWRLVTGHVLHISHGHFWLNVAAFFPLAWFSERVLGHTRKFMVGTFLFSAMLINAWVWWALPDIQFYAGLSAYLNTLYALVMLGAWERTRGPIFLLFLAGDGAKIAYEYFSDASLSGMTLDWHSLPSTHAVGLAAGIMIWFWGKVHNNVTPN